MEAVAACMAHHAAMHDPDAVDAWTIAGLLHDFDYERHPTMEEHPRRSSSGVSHLRRLASAVDEAILEAILGHAPYTGVARTSPMALRRESSSPATNSPGSSSRWRRSGRTGSRDSRRRASGRSSRTRRSPRPSAGEDIAEGVADHGRRLGADEAEHLDRCIEAIAGASDRVLG